ncbi:carotenoid oxygenase family protein [Actinophytocola sp.]|uniref:carotenoid oxygenase family protein n=1 Tax=Actinophytocola sp. TaxID=1872138 RepID=UPI002D4806EA|nr:carotenoid oxygenase family protein [Actinophytocola sp.]HYQ70253.1 carotenoid oxygenase family protein [Actinophytocola sp.]
MRTTAERLRSTETQELWPARGEVPQELAGTLLQAYPHPGLCSRRHPETAPLAVSGIRFRDGRVSWYLAGGTRRPCPFVGPVATLGDEVRLAALPAAVGTEHAAAAWPVRDPEGPYWHTVVTFADRPYADHLVVGDGGLYRSRRRFALDHAPLMHTVALTRRYVVLVDPPVTYHRAAALIGERSPYAWDQDRPARIGLLSRTGDEPAPRWFDIDPGYTFRAVNAYDDGDQVVVDLLWHDGNAGNAGRALPEPGPAPVVRWTLDLPTGAAWAHTLTAEARVAVTDPSAVGRAHRFVYGAAGSTITRHDLKTGHTAVHELGPGRRAGQPVPVHSEEGDWLLAFVEDVAHRGATALVLDAADVAAAPVAEVPLPAGVPVSTRATWIAGTRR